MTTRTTYSATFFYPGSLFPEEVTRNVPVEAGVGPELADVLAVAPTETEGTYFVKDGWYAAALKEKVEVLYTSSEPDQDDRWVVTDGNRIGSWIVGTKVHVDDIPDDDLVLGGEARVNGNLTLKSNIRANTPDGFAVKTRCGNWQFAHDWDHVISDSEARHG